MTREKLKEVLKEMIQYLPDGLYNNFTQLAEAEEKKEATIEVLTNMGEEVKEERRVKWIDGIHHERLCIGVYTSEYPDKKWNIVEVRYTNRKGYDITVDSPFF